MNQNKVIPINDERLVLSGGAENERDEGERTPAPNPGQTPEFVPATAVLASEDSAGFSLLLAAFRRDYQPVNTTEDALVQLLTRHFWSAFRNARVETGLIEDQMDAATRLGRVQDFAKKHAVHEYDTRRLGIAFGYDCGEGNAQMKIVRAGTSHDLNFLRIQLRLRNLQALRTLSTQAHNRAA